MNGIRNIYLHEWLRFMVNVSKYSSPMEYLGCKKGTFYGISRNCCNMTCAILTTEMSKIMTSTFPVDEGDSI